MKKRILIIDGPLGGGGAERVLIDILRNLDYSAVDVDLALICKGGILMDEVPPQVNVIELWNGYSFGYKIAYRLSKWFHCNALLSMKMNGPKLRSDYDLEISFLEGMPLKLGALRNSSAKKVTWVHADLSKRYEEPQFYQGEEIEAYNKMDAIVNVSKDCENAFRLRFPDCKIPLKVIYNPIDRQKILEMSKEALPADYVKPHAKFHVVTVGRLTSPKNPKRLLDVAKMAKAAEMSIHFTWIGDGELRKEVEQECDRLGLGDMVSFVGFYKNPFPILKTADLMLVTSDFEGFCLVICEAMCLGIPVISTKTAGPSEIIGDNQYGILTDFQAESIFHHLNRLYWNADERKQMSAKALSRPDIYSVSQTVSEIYKLL